MTCILADDEEPARKLLEEYITKTSVLELAGSFQNGMDARNFLLNHSVDLAFFDINMPELTGLELIRSLTTKPMIILTTAYSEHALDGFELNALDYLVKPFSLERFLRAVDKAASQLRPLPINEVSTNQRNDFFFIKADHKLIKINFDEVIFIEGLREYVRIHTVNKKYITLLSLNKLEEELPAEQFIRIHKSTIVKISRIKIIHNNSVELDGQNFSLGATYKEALMRLIGKKGIY